MRVRRSFAFLDLCDFTTLSDVQGDERAVGLLAGFRLTVREVCSRRGVRIAKWLGDGAMLVAVETEPLVGTVLEIDDRVRRDRSPLDLRAGVAAGEVILLEGDDYIGRTVNLAARLCDLAGHDGVLATWDVAAEMPPWAASTDLGERDIRGLGRPVRLVRLGTGRDGGALVADPVCGMRIPVAATLEERVDGSGRSWRFCSASCAETWDGRRDPGADGLTG